MDQAEALTPWQAETAVKALRVGNTATEAAELVDVKPGALYAAARTDPDLLLALAGHDPYAYDAEQILQQADYIRLLAIGFQHTQAIRVLFHGDDRVQHWRTTNRPFAELADQARTLNPPEISPRREHRFTPDRVRVFLQALRDGQVTALAAEAAGITNAVIYQRRRRDAAFREAMNEARAAARPREHEAITEDQWADFRRGVQEGMTLRRAALDADINPQVVYDRRRAEPEFRRDTDRWRGVPGVA